MQHLKIGVPPRSLIRNLIWILFGQLLKVCCVEWIPYFGNEGCLNFLCPYTIPIKPLEPAMLADIVNPVALISNTLGRIMTTQGLDQRFSLT